MPLLDDNTVLPSFMSAGTMGVGQSMNMFTNYALRSGEVREIIGVDDKKSLSGRFIEYTVEVNQYSDGTSSSMTYFNCLLANTFGGAADQFRYTLRKSDSQKTPEDGIGVGSKVLLLCIDGARNNALIIGGVRDLGTDKDGSKYEGKDNDADGHHLHFEFNGIQAKINKEGELTVMYRGATKADGTLDDNANADASESKVIMNKDGGIKIHTKDEKQYVFLNHKDKKIEVLADTEWNVKVNEKLVFNTGKNIEVHTDAEMKLDAANNVKITSSGVLVGAATDNWLLASTYRQSESSMHQDFLSSFAQLATLLGTMGSTLTTASAAHAAPIVGPIIGAPALAAAGAAAISCATAFGKLAAAVGQFEGKTTTYLSTKNKND